MIRRSGGTRSMEYSDRQQQIIEMLKSSDKKITGKSIALSLNVSKKTIQNDIKMINTSEKLIDSTNRGYSMINSNKTPRLIKPEHSFSQEHRLIERLLESNIPINLFDLSDELYISDSTLNRQLQKIKKLTAKFNLLLIKRSNYVSLTGTEIDKRKLLSRLISDELFNDDTTDKNKLYESIKSIVTNSISKYDFFTTENYLKTICVNIFVSINRIKMGDYVNKLSNYTDLKQTIEYKIAQDINYSLHDAKILDSNQDDDLYISSLIYGFVKPKLNDNAYKEVNIDKNLEKQIEIVLNNVFSSFLIKVDIADVLVPFTLHVEALVKRANAAINDVPPMSKGMLKNIKDSSPFIYEVAIKVAQKLSNIFNIKVSENEIGLISLHIGYLLNKVESSNKVKVIFINNQYGKTIESLKKQLLSNYSSLIDISTVESSQELETVIPQIDLVISTQPINLIGIDTVLISPFLSINDHVKIDEAIHKAMNKKQQFRERQHLASYFQDNLFQSIKESASKIEVINSMSKKIIDMGITGNNFTSSIIDREKASSTCFFNSFAIPHATNIAAKKTVFSVLISEKGIKWDDHIIHLVIMTAINHDDWKNFVPVYNGLVKSLSNPDTRNKLIKCKSLENFLNILYD